MSDGIAREVRSGFRPDGRVVIEPFWVDFGREWEKEYGKTSFKVFCAERHVSRFQAERKVKAMGYTIRRPREWSE